MSRPLKVGIYVVLSLILMGFGVFLIGDNRRAWERKVEYRAAWLDVAGLKAGGPIRSGGFDIGHVTAVDYSDDPGDPKIYVTLLIAKREARRIRQDSVARISAKGLLGDKMIELTLGQGGKPAHDPKVLLRSEEPSDMMARANELADGARKVVERLDPLAASLGDPALGSDVKGAVSSLRVILDGVAQKDSIAHRLLMDPTQSQKMDQVLDNLVRATAQLDSTLANVNSMTHRVKTGPGLAHTMLYDEKVAGDVALTVSEVSTALRAVRTGPGIVHSIVYGDDSSAKVMANLGAATDDLRQIMGQVRAGKGTLGGLLVDPSIYEDIKSAVGNVERNQVLRALVRYSIKADETKPRVPTPSPSAGPKP